MFFILTGKISLVHKKTKTYIKELLEDMYMGEISFFSELPR